MNGGRHGERFLAGRTALITGAGKRIGAAMARALSEQGAALVIHFRDSETEARALAGQLQAAGAEAFGAAFYLDTPAFGVSPPLLESFSSQGGVPILFDKSGNPIAADLREKPEIVPAKMCRCPIDRIF